MESRKCWRKLWNKVRVKDYLSDIKWKEHHIAYGFRDNKNTYYLIRRRSKNVGLFSYVLTALGHIKYAEEHNYVPVVDMLHYESPYLDKENPKNVWEYYFEQPRGICLDDLKLKRNIVLSTGELPVTYPGFDIMQCSNRLEQWRDLYKRNIRYNDATSKFLIEQYNKYFSSNERVMGVLCRGTDYETTKPKGHPIQPRIEEVLEKVKLEMVNQKCDKVYLATEDKIIYDRFLHQFGEKLIFPEIEFRPYNGEKLITEIEVERKDDKLLKGLEYLMQIDLLSKCNCFIGSGCGGSYGALLMSEGFEWQYFWELGVY